MEVIVCLDDKGGMLFNRRRQSKDKALVEDVLHRSVGRRLLISSFSAAIFPEGTAEIIADEDFLGDIGQGDVCFVENKSLQPIAGQIDCLVVYRWNRVYPADFYCDIDLDSWQLQESADFVGSSHDKITREVYSRC